MSPITKLTARVNRETGRLRTWKRYRRYREDPRTATWILAIASILAIPAILWFGRDITFSGDELVWVSDTPYIDLTTIFTPHGGHLLALTKAVYWPLLEVFGLGYLPFQLLAISATLLAVWLLYFYGRRRADHFVALAPCLVLLFFGSDYIHLFQGNGFPIMLSLALGVASLMCLDRGDKKGDRLTCLWLTIGVFTYTVILPFVAAVLLLVLIRPGRRRRIWIALVPVATYLVWRIWMVLADVSSSGGGIDLTNIVLVPAWTFQSLAGILNALTGISFYFSGGNTVGPVEVFGPPLAIAFIALFVWKVTRFGLTKAMLAAVTIMLALFTLQALASNGGDLRIPGGDSRYMYPGAFVVILVGFELARSWRPGPKGLLVLGLVAFAGIGSNLTLMRDNTYILRDSGYQLRAYSGALRLGLEGRADGAGPTGQTGLRKEITEFGYAPSELEKQIPDRREYIDQVIVGALGAKLSPPVSDPADCQSQLAGPDGFVRFESGPETLSLKSPAGGEVLLGRFADSATQAVGTLAPDVFSQLHLPADSASESWLIAVSTPKLKVCTDV